MNSNDNGTSITLEDVQSYVRVVYAVSGHAGWAFSPPVAFKQKGNKIYYVVYLDTSDLWLVNYLEYNEDNNVGDFDNQEEAIAALQDL